MAEDVKKEKKPGVVAKVSRSLRDMRGEMKKVVWPTRKQTLNNTIVVLCFMVVMAVIIGAFDFGLSALIRLMVGS